MQGRQPGGGCAEQAAETDRCFLILRDAHAADHTPGTYDPVGLFVGRHVTDGLEHGVYAVSAGQLPDLRDAFLATRGHHVGGPELTAEVGTGGVASHQDDLLGTEPLRREHSHQPDSAVADDRDLLPGADAGRVSAAW